MCGREPPSPREPRRRLHNSRLPACLHGWASLFGSSFWLLPIHLLSFSKGKNATVYGLSVLLLSECLHALGVCGCVCPDNGVCMHTVCVCVRVCVPGRGPFKPEREPSSSLSGASRGSRRRAVGNHRPASADYSLLRKMRFLSHRNSVIKIKYNVWLDSAKCTSTRAF